jgi:hypothetical protein
MRFQDYFILSVLCRAWLKKNLGLKWLDVKRPKDQTA